MYTLVSLLPLFIIVSVCEQALGLIGLPEKAEGSPEPLDSKWMASGGGKVTRDFCSSR